MLHGYLLCVFRALCDGVCYDLGDGDELLLLELGEEFSVFERFCIFDLLKQFAVDVFGLFGLEKDYVIAVLFYPLVLETIALPNARGFLSEDFLRISSIMHPC